MSKNRKHVEIISDLMRRNICKYCCLRYVNEKNLESYKNVEQFIANIVGANEMPQDYAPLAKHGRPNPCSACLGLLQLSEDEDFMNNIAERILARNYDADDVTFALTLPITILLRDYSLWLYVSNTYKEHFGDPFNSVTFKRSTNTVSVKDAWKLLAGQKLADKMNRVLNSGVDGTFHVSIHIDYENDSEETACIIDMFPDTFKNRTCHKRKFHGEVLTRKSVDNALSLVNLEFFRDYYPVPPNVPNGFVTCGAIDCVKDSLFLAGRYNKYSRNLCQTPWLINGERRMDSSVEEIISAPISRMVDNCGVKFSSSGREDVDVRTLGKGRPFILEVMNPKKTKFSSAELRTLETKINRSKDVSVRDLQVVKKYDLVHIKLGEQSKTKTYTSYCYTKLHPGEDVPDFEAKLADLKKIKNLTIRQKTPIRVLHRRSMAVRPRTVFWMEGKLHERQGNLVYFKLTLQVDAGTYVKEFVHGDFGRTKASLSEILGREVDILALDVDDVALEWPPAVEYPPETATE